MGFSDHQNLDLSLNRGETVSEAAAIVSEELRVARLWRPEARWSRLAVSSDWLSRSIQQL
jgi:hypothetical protein